MKLKVILSVILLIGFAIGCNIINFEEPQLIDGFNAKVVQTIDADTLNFYNERQFRNFLRKYLLADYAVIPTTFIPNQAYLSVVPNNGYYNVIDPETGNFLPSGEHYLREELFAGKYYVSFKDHNHTWKLFTVMIDSYCPEGDMNNVTEWITNPYTGQVVAFHNVYNWSDRNGQNIYNLNLKLWLLWDLPEEVVSFEIDATHAASGCDYTFVDAFPGHETMELRFMDMNSTYSILR